MFGSSVRRIVVAVATFFVGAAFALSLVASEVRTFEEVRALRVDNYSDGDVQRYPVALLRGSAPGVDVGTVVVENLSSARPARISRASVRGGRFKILVELVPGLNRLTIAVGAARIDFSLVYRKSCNRNIVRLVYFVDSTGDETFEIPAFWSGAAAPTFSSDFQNKMRTAALLWQTATAERLNDAGLGRRTFALEFDEQGDVVVDVCRGKKTADEYRALSEEELFREIYREIKNAPETSDSARAFVLIAFGRRGERKKNVEKSDEKSDFKGGENVGNGENGKFSAVENGDERRDESGAANGRLALGGGAIGTLDATTLFSWPDALEDVERFFSDSRPIPKEYASDSGFRRTRWALSASTLGAGLHELGHAFGLDHSSDPGDFMSRGFDRFNRIFTVVEPPCATAPEPLFFSDESAATWSRASAEKLIRSFWIEE